jgi:hypothetical protein
MESVNLESILKRIDVLEKQVERLLAKEKRSKFTPPTIEEIVEYVQTYVYDKRLQLTLNYDEAVAFADKFEAHYTRNGWKVGTASVKDWKACVRSWKLEQFKNSTTQINSKNGKFSTSAAELVLQQSFNL